MEYSSETKDDSKCDIVYQLLCMSCLGAGDTLHTLTHGALQLYRDAANHGRQLVHNISPRVCWECEILHKKVLLFRERVTESHNLLNSSATCDVTRQPRLQPHSDAVIDIPPLVKECDKDKERDLDADKQEIEVIKWEILVDVEMKVEASETECPCPGCLCRGRSLHNIGDRERIYYMGILKQHGCGETSPRLCWECGWRLRIAQRFSHQTADSYRTLLPSLQSADVQDVTTLLCSGVSRPPQLRRCVRACVDIPPTRDMDDDSAQQPPTVIKAKLERRSPHGSSRLLPGVPEYPPVCSPSGRIEPSAAVPAAASEAAAVASTSGASGARKRAAATATKSSSSLSKKPVRFSRRPGDIDIERDLADSGSELDSGDDDDEGMEASPDKGTSARSLAAAKEEMVRGRQENLNDLHDSPVNEAEYGAIQDEEDEEYIRSLAAHVQGENEVSVDMEGEEVPPQDVGAETVHRPPVNPDAYVFAWSDNFSNFTGEEETYLRSPGPQSIFQDPTEVFLKMWDRPIMELIVAETNRYAWQTISQLSETGQIPANLDQWRETTVEEIYMLFAMFIYMSHCMRTDVGDYWRTDVLEMPKFRALMSRNRFNMLMRFLHYVDNEAKPPGLSSYQKKIFKIAPILDHCNRVFPSLYTPARELSLDESLLLWKGHLSWVQSIRTKAARRGIKSYDLCEAATGYLLRTLLYAGKESSMHAGHIHGFKNVTAKVVLEMMDGYLDLGHRLYMDSWYNQLPLARYLKSRGTDVIGTMTRNRKHVPDVLKSLKDTTLQRGQQVARHCGDITLISWMDVGLVTAISTCHNDLQATGRRAGQDVMKPLAIADYNQYMGGVDKKDQMLSMYLMERKRKRKWYIKVFSRLFNTSLLNTYIIYQRNPMPRLPTHRDLRLLVAQGLVNRFRSRPEIGPINPLGQFVHRLDGHPSHFPEHTPAIINSNRRKSGRCARCSAKNLRSTVQLQCSRCKAYLCVGTCWSEYHTLADLK